MKLTTKEKAQVLEAVELAKRVETKMRIFAKADEKDIPKERIWELRNEANQIQAILYNVHGGVYREGVRS